MNPTTAGEKDRLPKVKTETGAYMGQGVSKRLGREKARGGKVRKKLGAERRMGKGLHRVPQEAEPKAQERQKKVEGKRLKKGAISGVKKKKGARRNVEGHERKNRKKAEKNDIIKKAGAKKF